MKLDWKKMDGLLPAVVQDNETLQILMLGYMDREALKRTLKSRHVTFYSRSKKRLWEKGESSGNFLEVVDIVPDCDGDAIQIFAKPKGPTCHRNTTSCFGEEKAPKLGFLGELAQVVHSRFVSKPKGSYTTRLLEEGLDRIIQKVGEEAVEVVIAAKGKDRKAFTGEVADLLFHLLVLLEAKKVPFSTVVETLRDRHASRPTH